jgi:hypothetical protein
MTGDLPQAPRPRGGRRRKRRAAACAGAGAVLGITAAVCAGLRAVSAQQAIAIAVPAATLLVAGLAVLALPDREAGRRRGAEAGFLAGSLLSLCKPCTKERGNSA